MADNGDDEATPSTTSRNFIDQRAATFHEAFGVQSSFNSALLQYTPTEVTDLEETLKRLQSSHSLQDEFQYDLLHATWDDVLRELARAQVAASDSETKGKTTFRRTWRKMGTTGGEFSGSVLEMFPNELAIVHGGLAAVFSVARLRSQNRRKILSAFEDIPNVLMMAFGKVESIPRDHQRAQQLHRSVGDLQATLLRVLPNLITELNPETFAQKLKSPFKGCELDNLLSMIRASSERVRTVAEAIMDSLAVGTNYAVHRNHETSQKILSTTARTENDIDDLRGKVNELIQHQKDFQQTLQSVHGKNSLLSFLTEYIKPGRLDTPMHHRSPEPSPPQYEPAIPVTPRRIFRLMSVSHFASLDAEKHIMRSAHSLDPAAVSRAAAMFRNPHVDELLHSSKSGVVLVNACGDPSQHGKISPISNVCATLTQALRRPPSASIVIAYFCGQHTTGEDGLAGPQGLLRSLVAFLVLGLVEHEHISDAEPIWFPNVQGDLAELSFADLCQVFHRLVELVPAGAAVHCIIDSISFYERDQWREDYDGMMRCFGVLVGSENLGASFKLLLTSPTVSRWLTLAPHQMVSLRGATVEDTPLLAVR